MGRGGIDCLIRSVISGYRVMSASGGGQEVCMEPCVQGSFLCRSLDGDVTAWVCCWGWRGKGFVGPGGKAELTVPYCSVIGVDGS